MASVVEICNIALSHIRAGSINALTESSENAQQCALHYPIVRDMCLRNGPWGFAYRVERVAQLSSTTVHNYAYVYVYPSQCLEIHRVALNQEDYAAVERTALYRGDLVHSDMRRGVPYEVLNVEVGGTDTRVIAANESALWAHYTRAVTDPNLFDSHFTVAVSHLLAAHIANALVGNQEGRALRKEHLSLYGASLSEAAVRDRNQRHIKAPDSEFITARR